MNQFLRSQEIAPLHFVHENDSLAFFRLLLLTPSIPGRRDDGNWTTGLVVILSTMQSRSPERTASFLGLFAEDYVLIFRTRDAISLFFYSRFPVFSRTRVLLR